MTTTGGNTKSQFDEAIDTIIEQVRDGLRHGFFELAVGAELINGQKRALTVKCGKSYRFIISAAEIEK